MAPARRGTEPPSSPGRVGGAVVHTIGHSTRTAEALVALLRAHGVEVVADVRRFPGSRRHPQFGRNALRSTLAAAGIDYVHVPALGGRRGAPAPDSPNGAWRVAQFRAYADAMGEPEWREALTALEARARAQPLAYLCAEALPWRSATRTAASTP